MKSKRQANLQILHGVFLTSSKFALSGLSLHKKLFLLGELIKGVCSTKRCRDV